MPGLIIEVQNRSQNPTKAQNEVKVQVRLRLFVFCASLWLWTVRIFAFASRLDSASSQWLSGGGRRDENEEAIHVLEVEVPELRREHYRLVDEFHGLADDVLFHRGVTQELGDHHRCLENRHQELENRHQELEDRHLELENQHRQLKNQHEEMAGQHRHQDTSVNVIKCISIGLMIVLLLERISYFHDHLSGFLVCVVVLVICLIRHN